MNYHPKTSRKFIKLNYWYEGKERSISLGEFLPCIREKEYLEKKLMDLTRKHKGSMAVGWFKNEQMESFAFKEKML